MSEDEVRRPQCGGNQENRTCDSEAVEHHEIAPGSPREPCESETEDILSGGAGFRRSYQWTRRSGSMEDQNINAAKIAGLHGVRQRCQRGRCDTCDSTADIEASRCEENALARFRHCEE